MNMQASYTASERALQLEKLAPLREIAFANLKNLPKKRMAI